VYFIGYAKMLETPKPDHCNGADPSTGIATGATLEILLIIAEWEQTAQHIGMNYG
jgi:hypothetical protein